MKTILRSIMTCGVTIPSACASVPVTPEQAAEICEYRARDAQAPTTDVIVGAGSDTGLFGAVSIGLSSDFIAGRDPIEVYEQCVFERTGAAPVRPPVLR